MHEYIVDLPLTVQILIGLLISSFVIMFNPYILPEAITFSYMTILLDRDSNVLLSFYVRIW